MGRRGMTFLQRAQRTARVIRVLSWIALLSVPGAMIAVRMKVWIVLPFLVLGWIVLFLLCSFVIGQLDCPCCKRSLRSLSGSMREVTSCPFCGADLRGRR